MSINARIQALEDAIGKPGEGCPRCGVAVAVALVSEDRSRSLRCCRCGADLPVNAAGVRVGQTIRRELWELA